MEETAGAPSSFAALSPRRLRASSRDGGAVVNRPPSPLTMLLSRHTRRREFVALTAGLAILPNSNARAQKVPIVGFLGQSTASVEGERAATFVQRLRELGWINGQNVTIELRWADGKSERSAEIAAEFVRRGVDVIATIGTPQVLVAK